MIVFVPMMIPFPYTVQVCSLQFIGQGMACCVSVFVHVVCLCMIVWHVLCVAASIHSFQYYNFEFLIKFMGYSVCHICEINLVQSPVILLLFLIMLMLFPPLYVWLFSSKTLVWLLACALVLRKIPDM